MKRGGSRARRASRRLTFLLVDTRLDAFHAEVIRRSNGLRRLRWQRLVGYDMQTAEAPIHFHAPSITEDSDLRG
jgi:hypothetical protein